MVRVRVAESSAAFPWASREWPRVTSPGPAGSRAGLPSAGSTRPTGLLGLCLRISGNSTHAGLRCYFLSPRPQGTGGNRPPPGRPPAPRLRAAGAAGGVCGPGGSPDPGSCCDGSEPRGTRRAPSSTRPDGRLRLAGRCAVVPAIQPPERASDWGVFLLGNPGPALRRVSRGNPRRAPVAVSRPSPAEAEAPAAPGPRAVAARDSPGAVGREPTWARRQPANFVARTGNSLGSAAFEGGFRGTAPRRECAERARPAARASGR